MGWFLLALIPCFLFSCAMSADHGQVQQKESLYDRVMRTGKIRCGYVTFYPNTMKDPSTGKFSGFAVDALELVAKKLGLTLEFTEEVGWGSLVEGLKAGRYDMIASAVWTNASRAKQAAFSKPLCYTPELMYARKGDKRFVNHLERVNSPEVKIATIDGETAQVIADADFPQAARLSMPQMTDCSLMLLNIATKKADVTMIEPAIANEFIRKNPGSLENICGNKPVRVFPCCWMFNRGEFEFKAMIDTVLDEVINSGAMDKIIARYEKQPGEIYRVALPYQSPK